MPEKSGVFNQAAEIFLSNADLIFDIVVIAENLAVLERHMAELIVDVAVIAYFLIKLKRLADGCRCTFAYGGSV